MLFSTFVILQNIFVTNWFKVFYTQF